MLIIEKKDLIVSNKFIRRDTKWLMYKTSKNIILKNI